jgi:hypothetical protein
LPDKGQAPFDRNDWKASFFQTLTEQVYVIGHSPWCESAALREIRAGAG